MNLKALHHYLTTLSPSEEKYRNGYVYDGWKDMPRKQCNGVEYTILDLDVAYSPLDNKPADHSPGLNAELSEISIKKNSRFSTVPEHIHTHIEINYVYSGSCPQVIDGHPITLQKNQVLLIDTNCPHSIAPLGENDIMISIIPKTDFLREHMFNQFSNDSILSRFFINAINEKTDHDHYLLFHSENDRRIPMFFNELFCECFDPSINSTDIIMHLFYTIMAELINVYEDDLTRGTPTHTTAL
ncbi:MAG: cupin domain-containing protein [Mediterraneibacter faecis]